MYYLVMDALILALQIPQISNINIVKLQMSLSEGDRI